MSINGIRPGDMIRSQKGLDGRIYLTEAVPNPKIRERGMHPNVRALFFEMFPVSIPEIEKYSDDEIRHRGMFIPSDTDEEESDLFLQNYTSVYRTINDIFELWRRGVNAYVPDASVERIYKVVTNHLQAWINFIKYEVHNQGAPFDDLFQLDQFASDLYEHTKFTEKHVMVDEPFQMKNELGIELGAGFFLGNRKGARFRHLFKTNYEQRLESGVETPTTLTRSDFQDELARMAAVYDLRPTEAARKSVRAFK
jgi:hypothetical protein